MITAAKTGLVAFYEGGTSWRPIVGWREEDGAPLVVAHKTGTLVAAADYIPPDGSKFWTVTVAESPDIAAVPGQGWSVAYQEDDGTVRETPVIAFAMSADGSMLPATADAEGSIRCRDIEDSEHCLVPPRVERQTGLGQAERALVLRALGLLRLGRACDIDAARELLEIIDSVP